MPPILLAALFISVQDTTRPPELPVSLLQSADSIAATEFAKDSLGSMTVGIVAGPNLVWSKSYGFADRGRTRPANAATVYRVASVTKQFTAVMLLQLVERGSVRLTDPVDKYLPQVRKIPSEKPVVAAPTLLQLATMTSGLARDPDDKRRSESGAPSRWKEVLIEALPMTRYARAPGTGYGYSNIGYSILGAALSHAAGEEYVVYQRRHILSPLGMVSSGFELTPAMRGHLAEGVDYDELHRDTLNYEDASLDHKNGLGLRVPGGGLYSTVGDIAKMVALAMGYAPVTVIRPETLKIRDNVGVASARRLDYGYGLGYQVIRWADTVAVGHSGNLAGYTSMILYDTERKFGVIVLRSAAGGNADAGRLGGRIFRKITSMLPRKTGG